MNLRRVERWIHQDIHYWFVFTDFILTPKSSGSSVFTWEKGMQGWVLQELDRTVDNVLNHLSSQNQFLDLGSGGHCS